MKVHFTCPHCGTQNVATRRQEQHAIRCANSDCTHEIIVPYLLDEAATHSSQRYYVALTAGAVVMTIAVIVTNAIVAGNQHEAEADAGSAQNQSQIASQQSGIRGNVKLETEDFVYSKKDDGKTSTIQKDEGKTSTQKDEGKTSTQKDEGKTDVPPANPPTPKVS